MRIRRHCVGLAAALLVVAASRGQAIRYEIVPEDETILFDDAEAIVMEEYVKRAHESIEKDKRRTAAAQLRRVAFRAGRAADLASGEARDALLAAKSEAQRLAYAAETRSDSAKRRIGEFAKRMENFISGEWVLLEAKHWLARGDYDRAKTFLTVANQQLTRRAKRTGKDEGKPFEEAGKSIGDFLKELDSLDAAQAATDIADLIKTARELKPAPPKKKVKKPTYTYRPYDSTTTYDSTTKYDSTRPGYNEYESGYENEESFGSDYDETGMNNYNNSDSESSGTQKSSRNASPDDEEYP